MKSSGTIFSITKLSLSMAIGFAVSAQALFACPCSEIKIPALGKDFSISEGLAFMKTDGYKKEFDKAIADAREICEKHKGEKNLAIVSDIDETVLDNSKFFATQKQPGWEGWDKWVDSADDMTLKPTAEFLGWARKNGIAVFFITGRSENERKDTIANLVKAGIAYDGLYMRPDNDHSPAEDMKTIYRKQIAEMGFKTIVSIGDQFSDLAGGYAEDCEKLPNKMYFIP